MTSDPPADPPGRRLRRGGIAAALTAAVAVALTAGLVTARAAAAPELPPVTAEELVASVIGAEPVALAATVSVDNRLGLPALPGAGSDLLAEGTSTARVWSDGAGGGRVALPRPDSERTYVRGGGTTWVYDSADRVATRIPAHADRPERAGTDPQAAAREIVAALRDTSTVAVDGTTEIAGRPAYTLVLTPQPGERTVLREVRAAVDAQTRTPLELTVLGAGTDPVLRIGVDEIGFGPQDPALFTFTPPPGAQIEDAPPPAPAPAPPEGAAPAVVGDGWDTVVVWTGPLPEDASATIAGIGTPVSGPWGTGHQVTTNAGSAIVTDDGRFAAGAVGTDVLGAALDR
ncbi:sigma-E factor regulatory protein RseB domain-containing protein [Pseudonocardia kongjuensis]|uniref:Sigma-E factor regulatory protein RseB domain-containing protein n=1 Tax=Pseudonocardia kongjuensis TaxID=102227 RepID=A0ABP4IZ70_9PSEU